MILTKEDYYYCLFQSSRILLGIHKYGTKKNSKMQEKYRDKESSVKSNDIAKEI